MWYSNLFWTSALKKLVVLIALGLKKIDPVSYRRPMHAHRLHPAWPLSCQKILGGTIENDNRPCVAALLQGLNYNVRQSLADVSPIVCIHDRPVLSPNVADANRQAGSFVPPAQFCEAKQHRAFSWSHNFGMVVAKKESLLNTLRPSDCSLLSFLCRLFHGDVQRLISVCKAYIYVIQLYCCICDVVVWISDSQIKSL